MKLDWCCHSLSPPCMAHTHVSLPSPLCWMSWHRKLKWWKNFFFFFSKFSDNMVLCAALILGQGNWKRECWSSLGGSIVQQHPLSSWRSLYSVLKTLQSFLNKFQPREFFWCVKIDLCKMGNCLFVVFLGQKQSFLTSAGFGSCSKCIFPLCPHCFILCWLLQNRLYMIKFRKGCDLYWLKILHYIFDV